MTHHWSADLIAPDEDFAGAPLLRKEFTLDAGHGDVVTAATLHVTAHGIVEPTLNGAAVSDDVLTPGWTSYEWRLRYAHLRRDRARGGDLGAGARPRQRLVPRPARLEREGRLLRLRAGRPGRAARRVRRRPPPGRRHRHHLAGRARPRPPRTTSTTARPSTPGWPRPRGRSPGADLTGWVGVHAVEHDVSRLRPYVGPPVRRQEVLRPVKVWTSPSGATLVDVGQNIVGWLRFTVQGPAGTRDHRSARRGARARRARHPTAALGKGDRPLRPQRRRRRLRTDQDLPRLPLRRGHGLARRA